jgi:aspartate carbamoyltransferase catalytic subunit
MKSLQHLLDIESLSKDCFVNLLENALQLFEISQRSIKKVPTLRGKSVINLFMEPSTRTRTSFELAAKRLSADAINISAGTSSVTKGETLLDTARNLEAMAPDILVIRDKNSGSPHFLAQYLKNTAVVNAGDGCHEHPTQALLDCLALYRHYGDIPSGKRVAIVGDVRHSRVARSNIFAHRLLGNEVRLVGPRTLVPEEFEDTSVFGEHVKVFHSLQDGITDCDVVMCLRMQLERAAGNFVGSLDEYSRFFGVTERVLREYAPHSVVMHPGPLNRGIEISSEVADGPRSLISEQVSCGVAARMAVLLTLGSRWTDEEVK